MNFLMMFLALANFAAWLLAISKFRTVPAGFFQGVVLAHVLGLPMIVATCVYRGLYG